MDNEVHDDKPPGRGRVLTEGVPTVDENSDVVIPVQKYQFLFPQHNEDRIAQLGDLEYGLWTNIFCFPLSTFERTNIQVQKPLTLSFSMKLGIQRE